MNKTITFLAKDLEKKMRLDKFLTENLKNLSRSQIKKIIVSKNIKINKKQIIASSEIIKENDLIEVNIPEKKTNDIKPKKINLDKNKGIDFGKTTPRRHLHNENSTFEVTDIVKKFDIVGGTISKTKFERRISDNHNSFSGFKNDLK